MKDQVAVEVKNIYKTFYIRDNQKSSLKSLVAGMFRQGKSTKFQALKNINVEFEKGDFVGIIGRNGSGKSTLLKLIANIYSADKGGEINIDGHLVPFLELGVGFNVELTGKENIYLNGTILGMTKEFLDEHFDEIVDFAGLRAFINNPVKNYSSGMLVRLAFSIAVKAEADIYILDEILSVGDALFQQKSVDTIKKFSDEGKTILYVSHNINSIREYCNKVLWIDRGDMKFFGDVEEGTALYKDSLFAEQKENFERKKQQELESRKNVGKNLVIKSAKVDVNDDNLNIKIDIEHKKKVDQLNFAVQILHEGVTLVSTINSAMDEEAIPSNAETVELSLKDVNLSPGNYTITVKAFGKYENLYDHEKREDYYTAENLYDIVENADLFKIDSKPGYRGGYGYVIFNRDWKY